MKYFVAVLVLGGIAAQAPGALKTSNTACQTFTLTDIRDAAKNACNGSDSLSKTLAAQIKSISSKVDEMGKKMNPITQDQLKLVYFARGYVYYPPEGFYFKLNIDCKMWADARLMCKNDGGDLIRLSEKNFDFFRAYPVGRTDDACSGGGHIWVGTSDKDQEGKWMWPNGDPVPKFMWWPGQPDNAGNVEHCAHMYPGLTYHLNDLPCERKLNYFCQIFP